MVVIVIVVVIYRNQTTGQRWIMMEMMDQTAIRSRTAMRVITFALINTLLNHVVLILIQNTIDYYIQVLYLPLSGSLVNPLMVSFSEYLKSECVSLMVGLKRILQVWGVSVCIPTRFVAYCFAIEMSGASKAPRWLLCCGSRAWHPFRMNIQWYYRINLIWLVGTIKKLKTLSDSNDFLKGTINGLSERQSELNYL